MIRAMTIKDCFFKAVYYMLYFGLQLGNTFRRQTIGFNRERTCFHMKQFFSISENKR